jgi:hypothetical protein
MAGTGEFTFPALNLALVILDIELNDAMRIDEVEIRYRALQRDDYLGVELGITVVCAGRTRNQYY